MAGMWFVRGSECVVTNTARDALFRGSLLSLLSGLAGTALESSLDTALQTREGEAYLFYADKYYRYDLSKNLLVEGPLAIAAHWPGARESAIGAGVSAACMLDKLTAALFSGSSVAIFDLVHDVVVTASSVDQVFQGVPAGTAVSAALVGGASLFLFTDALFFELDLSTRCVRMGYPRPIDSSWASLEGMLPRAGFNLSNEVGSRGMVPAPPARADEGAFASTAARALTAAQALAVLKLLHEQGALSLDVSTTPRWATLGGPRMHGVELRRWDGRQSVPNSPRNVDPRNLVALARLTQWLAREHGVDTLVHLGIDGDETGRRADCHGQGRAFDLASMSGKKGETAFQLSVLHDWGLKSVPNELDPSGPRLARWPSVTRPLSFRLQGAPDSSPEAAALFASVYSFAANQWQDRNDIASGTSTPSRIGERSFVITPDYPASDPNGQLGREAHQDHMHFQIGKTGRE